MNMPPVPEPRKPASRPSRWTRFWCGVMGWHPHRDRETTGFDGASLHQRCGRCGFVGLVDSTGSLF